MFGFIVPHSDSLSKIDKELFRSFYCSLCRKIGERSNPARIFLSYDLTFLAILTSALDEDETPFGKEKRCPLHPLRPTPDINSKHISYAADISVMLIKEKIKDDIKDENKWSQRFMDILVKDKIQNDEARNVIKTELSNLGITEKENILNPDISGDSFAKLVGKIFEMSPINEKHKKAIYWLGYNLGRWVYLLDAISDLKEDIKKGVLVDMLDEKLREVIEYRMKYKESSLSELASIISLETGVEISKSGLNHRFRKIKEILEKIESKDK